MLDLTPPYPQIWHPGLLPCFVSALSVKWADKMMPIDCWNPMVVWWRLCPVPDNFLPLQELHSKKHECAGRPRESQKSNVSKTVQSTGFSSS